MVAGWGLVSKAEGKCFSITIFLLEAMLLRSLSVSVARQVSRQDILTVCVMFLWDLETGLS